jgi:phosphatidylserine decarboxylase
MLAKGSAVFLLIPAVMLAVMVPVVFILGPHWFLLLMTGFWLTVLVLFIIFFRDPERAGPEEGLLSPADGRVLPSRGDRTVRIFMNIHDCHVNRAPLAGEVMEVEHREGSYRPAYSKDSDLNERNRISIETEKGELEVMQIAGTLARRIETYVKPGDVLQRGQRLGIIKLGSRVDVTLPDGYVRAVKDGDRVLAGVTVLAEFSKEALGTTKKKATVTRTAGSGDVKMKPKLKTPAGGPAGMGKPAQSVGKERQGEGDGTPVEDSSSKAPDSKGARVVKRARKRVRAP